jgi:hypothetical protein
MNALQVHIVANVTEVGKAQRPIFHCSGPNLPLPLSDDAETRRKLLALFEYFLLQASEATKGSLPSLPENLSEQPRYLDKARIWLNQVESGKKGAHCTVWEDDKGQRHIHIVTTNG